ncbi:glycosyltransferase [uncultured Winogradskyella sp.]|uniref:glycosyltransferase n=1 Tax=uncultured Winogradskyella sp. TaxID=395353 RepID=UPI00260951FE|nr:glycosyltransferase [uncultured Winogradskyella sp.]
MKKILFITHDANRTGAPLILLYFMQWLKHNHPHIEIHGLSLRKGVLSDSFSSVSKNYMELENLNDSILKRTINKLKKTSTKAEFKKSLLAKLKHENYDIIYANSIMSLDWGIAIKSQIPKSKLLLHLHELQVSIKYYAPNLDNDKEKVDKYICASKLVQNNIVQNYNVPTTKTKVIYEFSKLKPIEINSEINENKEIFIVGASGTVNLRKGYDLFLCIAKAVVSEIAKNVEFHWVGKFSNKKTELEVLADIKKANLQEHVFFKGEFENPEKEFSKFDMFMMSSREDPFPLVCIEVANLGKPIICFEGATGTEEILQNGGGKIVPYLDINAAAKVIINYISNPEEILTDGKKAHEEFKDFNIENQSSIIYQTLNAL